MRTLADTWLSKLHIYGKDERNNLFAGPTLLHFHGSN
ncbi:MAG: hypothetical protein QOE55_2860 [Acidobacteriaceae bacterium]|jgi:hypothetical protein|nr:hypothetical protein [Acidobacteriaceae bacterium]